MTNVQELGIDPGLNTIEQPMDTHVDSATGPAWKRSLTSA